MADDRRPDGQQPGPWQQPGQQQPGPWQQPGQQQPGQMRYQDGDTTTPREPTLAEQKARERAYQRQQAQEASDLAAAKKKTDTRRRVMVGSGVSVGVVALVASFYSGYTYSMQKDAAQATCTVEDENGDTVAQPEEYCEDGAAQQHGHYNPSTGMMMMPIFLGGGNFGGSVPASQYKHSYSPVGSSTSAPGQKVNNPNFTKPSGQITSQSGKTIQRGGFGIGSKSGS